MDLVDRVIVSEGPLRVNHRWIKIGFDLRTLASAALLAVALIVMGFVSAKTLHPEQPGAVAIACDHALARCVISPEGGSPSEIATNDLRVRSDWDRNGKNSPSSWNLEFAKGHTTLMTVKDYRSKEDPYGEVAEGLNAFLADESASPIRLEVIERPPEAALTFLYGLGTALSGSMFALVFLSRGRQFTFRAAERDITTKFGRRALPVARWEDIRAVRVDERADGRLSMTLERAQGPALRVIEGSRRAVELKEAAVAVSSALGVGLEMAHGQEGLSPSISSTGRSSSALTRG